MAKTGSSNASGPSGGNGRGAEARLLEIPELVEIEEVVSEMREACKARSPAALLVPQRQDRIDAARAMRGDQARGH